MRIAAAGDVIASGKPGFEVGGFASNGFGDHSPGSYSRKSRFLRRQLNSDPNLRAHRPA